MSIVVGMSGGVDSATAAALLKELGEDVVGVTLFFSPTSSCCDLAATARARAQCEYLGIRWHHVDVREAFEQEIVERFWTQTLSGETPNPCVWCNEVIKWRSLLSVAAAIGADRVATGHYARIERSARGVRLCRASDRAKDQTYFLYRLTEEQRSRTVFPLAGMTKQQTVDRSAEFFPAAVTAKRESQDLCFLTGGLRNGVLARHIAVPGEVVDKQGNVLGCHDGLALHTIGQRSGIGVSASHPLYVVGKDARANRLVVGRRDDCMLSSFRVHSLQWSDLPTATPTEFDADVVVRYRAAPVRAHVTRIAPDMMTVDLMVSVFAATPGQSAVFYENDAILGGGIIV
jgi:tRNA-specific 2-thiouridylase